jgi:hypothetical protein
MASSKGNAIMHSAIGNVENGAHRICKELLSVSHDYGDFSASCLTGDE